MVDDKDHNKHRYDIAARLSYLQTYDTIAIYQQTRYIRLLAVNNIQLLNLQQFEIGLVFLY